MLYIKHQRNDRSRHKNSCPYIKAWKHIIEIIYKQIIYWSGVQIDLPDNIHDKQDGREDQYGQQSAAAADE